VARLLAALPSYFYSTSDDGVWVHLFAEGRAQIDFGTTQLTFTQHTRYPWDGQVEITVDGVGAWALYVRIPAWCDEDVALSINGRPFEGSLLPGEYAVIRRTWHSGDRVILKLPIKVRYLASNPAVLENRGRVAVFRGPILYCAEQCDNADLPLVDVTLTEHSQLAPRAADDALTGGVAIGGAVDVRRPAQSRAGWDAALYKEVQRPIVEESSQAEITLVPYYAWANRAAGPMQVWLRFEANRGVS
jgi:DUF1680 family protein